MKKALIPVSFEKRGALSLPQKAPALSVLSGFLSPNTKRAYERDWKDFFGVDDLRSLTMDAILAVGPDQVVQFRDTLRTVERSSSTICRKMSAIRTLYSQLLVRGLIQRNPADSKLVRSPKRSTIKKASPLTPEELRALLAAPDKETEIGLRDYAMINLACQAGLRREELCTLLDSNLAKYGDRWSVAFEGKGGKERRVPLHQGVVDVIDAWRKVRPRNAAALFTAMDGGRCTEDTFYKAVKKYGVRAGFKPDVKRVHPHGLRATYATILYEDGVPLKEIQILMGHSRAETTIGYFREADLNKSKAPDVMARATEERNED